jgi:YidC/Oxa1 family membrane protein insertase
MVDLGSGMFAFVKYINRWIILPVFDLFRKFTSNYGIVILLLTLFIPPGYFAAIVHQLP